MRLKSYFAATVEAALNLARQDLGPYAMLVESRRTGAESRHLGDYEVVCAVVGSKKTESEFSSLLPANGFRAPGLDKLSQEVSELKRYMERMAATIARSSAGLANLRSNAELADVFSALTEAEVAPSLAHDIVSEVFEQLNEDANIRMLLYTKLEKLINVDPRLGREQSKGRITALVGPPGSGKTTCLVKLAAQFGLMVRKSCQIFTLDTYRIAAAEQLRSLAAILGVGFQVMESVSSLSQALEEQRQKDLILIDTPGLAPKEMTEADDIARLFSTHPEIDTQLVLPATLKSADLLAAAERYRVFKPSRLIFTHIDETATFGPILNVVVKTGLPVSFLASGQQIPEDLEPVSKRTLAALILKQEFMSGTLSSAAAA
jgi:flagellar biosynthesis protein FlhF